MANETPSILITAQLNKAVSINNITADLKEIEKQLQPINIKYNIDNSTIGATQQTTAKVTKSTQDLSAQLSILQNRATGAYGNLQKYLSQNSQVAEKLPNQVNAIKSSFQSLNGVTDVSELKSGLAQANSQVTALKGSARELGIEGRTFGETIGNDIGKLGQWLSATTLLIGAFHEIKSGIQDVIDLNTNLTQTATAMNTTVDNLGKIATAAQTMSQNMGANVNDVLDIMHVYANVNETADSIIKKTQADVILSNISGMSGAQTTDDLQALQQQFNLTDDQLMHVDDAITKIAQNLRMNYQGAIQDIADGTKTAGAMAQQAGMTFEQFSAIIGATAEKTRLSGSEIATSMKMIMARVGQIKSADPDVTDNDKAASTKALQSIGVDKFDKQTGQLRNMYDVLSDVAGKWNTLTKNEKEYVANASAGQRQFSTFESIMLSWGKAQDLATQAVNANGNALKQQQTYMESTEAKAKQFNATVTSLWQNTISSKEIGDIIQLGTYLVQNIVPVLTTIAGIVITIQAKNIASFIANIGNSIRGTVSNIGAFVEIAQEAGGGIKGLAAAFDTLKVSEMGVTGVIGLVVAALGLITMGVSSYNQAQEEAQQKAVEAAKNYKTESDSLGTLISQYKEIESHTSITSDDKNTLKSIQDQLNSSFGTEAKQLDLVNGKYSDQIDKLDKLSKAKADEYIRQNQDAYNTNQNILTSGGNTTVNAYKNRVSDSISSTKGVDTSEAATGYYQINGTLTQRIAILKEILDKSKNITNQSDAEKVSISAISNEYTKLTNQYSKANNIVQQMYSAQLTSQFSSQMSQMTNDAKKFSDALKSGDTSAQKKATDDFQKLNKEVENTANLSPELKKAFQDWVNGLDAFDTSTKSTPTGIDAVTSSLSSFDTQCKSIHTSITNLGTSLKDLDTAMAQVKEGTVLSGEEALNLVDKYGLSVDAIKSVAGGYTIEYSALEALRTAKIKATEQSIKDDISRAEQTLATARSALTAYGIEISGIQSLAQAKAELANIDNEKPPDMAGTSAEQQWENKKTAVKQVIDQYNTLATSQSKLDTLNKELSIVSQPNYTSAINKTTAAQKENTVAEKAAEKAAKAHVDALNAEKDALEKQKQALQDSSDQMSKDESAINSLLETTMAMLKQKYEDQKQALQDVIDKQSQANEATQKADDIALKSLQDKIKLEKDLLEQQKNEHEYQENLADKEKSVADIQAKLVSINPDNSDSNQKRKLDLQQQLSEKQKELTDFNYEHDYTVKSNAYDKEEARIEKLYADKKQMEDNDLQHIKDINEAKIKNIEKNSESEENIRKEALALINGKTNTFYNQLLAYNKKYGDSVDANVSTKWRSALDALSRYNGKQTDTLGTLNQLVTKMADYASKIKGVDGQIKGLETAISTAQKAVDGLKSSAGTAASSAVGSMNNAASAARKAEDNARRTSLQAQIANLITQKGKQNNYGAQNAIQSQIDALQFDLNHIPKYASGTLSSTGGLSILDELGLGSELIIHAPTQGRLVNMEKGGVVYDAAKSKNLDSFALNPQQYIANQLSQMKLPSFSNIQSSNSSNPYIDASVTINGNADNTAIAKIAQIQKELPQKIIDMIDNQRIGAGVKPNPKNM